ncbi:MIT (microtubule interacting and transport) domain [seawater metagenome]|uniref:MIT (Microtubule interacting and transport) domain n=1 Tax=seawater metagenome TaxID=1561972 RepID=A0A5E8CJX6_9ZZZZ
MLTYRDEDLEIDRDINEKSNLLKYCCFSSIFCLLIVVVLLFTFGLKSICLIPFMDKLDLCIINNSNYSNSSNITGYTIYQNNTNYTTFENITNYTSFENITNYTTLKNEINNTNSENYTNNTNIENTNNFRNSDKEINKFPNFNKVGQNNLTNVSNSLFINQAITPKTNIEQNNREKRDYGEAIGISIGSVLGFILLIAGFVYGLKKGPTNIKKLCTNRTASKHNAIQLTDEELKFYQVKNPLQEAIENNQGGQFVEAVNILKKAIEKDRARDFPEAINLYNKGIDIVVKCLKSNCNANDRFAIAKKIDIYIQRVNYISNCVENEKLIQDIKI